LTPSKNTSNLLASTLIPLVIAHAAQNANKH